MMSLLFALACAPDDVTDKVGDDTAADTGGDSGGGDSDSNGDTGGDTGSDTETGGDTGPDSIVGDWLSDGDNISVLFAGDPFNYVSILCHFGGDGTYTVQATDVDGQQGTLSGTYAADNTTEPGTIVLTQANPYTATAEGIWDVSGTTLTYEVVQTDPDYGFAPPTPESGFGTTSGPNIEPGVNVQVYVSQ